MVSALLALSTAPAQADFVPQPDDDPQLAQAATSWAQRHIDDYTLSVRRICYCPRGPRVVTVVRDGRVRRVTQGDKVLRLRRGTTMPQLYRLVRNAHESADWLEVAYTARGVPSSISIDPDRLAVDEEVTYHVSLSRL